MFFELEQFGQLFLGLSVLLVVGLYALFYYSIPLKETSLQLHLALLTLFQQLQRTVQSLQSGTHLLQPLCLLALADRAQLQTHRIIAALDGINSEGTGCIELGKFYFSFLEKHLIGGVENRELHCHSLFREIKQFCEKAYVLSSVSQLLKCSKTLAETYSQFLAKSAALRLGSAQNVQGTQGRRLCFSLALLPKMSCFIETLLLDEMFCQTELGLLFVVGEHFGKKSLGRREPLVECCKVVESEQNLLKANEEGQEAGQQVSQGTHAEITKQNANGGSHQDTFWPSAPVPHAHARACTCRAGRRPQTRAEPAGPASPSLSARIRNSTTGEAKL